MPPPTEFLYTEVEELDIAYDEMLKYLSDTEITAPKRAEMRKI